jgi:hypothetical protein
VKVEHFKIVQKRKRKKENVIYMTCGTADIVSLSVISPLPKK